MADEKKDQDKDKNKDKDKEKDKKDEQNELGKKVQACMDWCIKTASGPAGYLLGAEGPDNYDCTGFISAGLQAAGFPISPCHGSAFDTGVVNCGFERINYSDAEGTAPLQAGDILSNPHHVELYIGNGQVVGAHSANKAHDDQVSVENWYANEWTEIYRCTGAKGVKNADGSTSVFNGRAPKSSDQGFRIIPKGGEMVHIIKLPDKKTFCEPIYPDYITVSDTVPQWALDNAIQQKNADAAQQSGQKIPDGDAKEKAPNGMHYYENDIKYLMENNKGLTREQAIETLSKVEKYTRKVKQEKDGTYTVVKKDDQKPADKNKDKDKQS